MSATRDARPVPHGGAAGNSALTRAEFDAAGARQLDRIDTDHDGYISRSEHEPGRALLRQ